MARSTIYSLPLMAMAKTVGVLFTSTPRLACKASLLRALITPVGWPLTIPAIYLWQPRRSMAHLLHSASRTLSLKAWRLTVQATYVSWLSMIATRILPPQSSSLLPAGYRVRSALCPAKVSAWPLIARAISSQPTPGLPTGAKLSGSLLQTAQGVSSLFHQSILTKDPVGWLLIASAISSSQ